MEIERKFLVRKLPVLSSYECLHLEQAYLCTEPVVRIRKQEQDYYLTYKGKGLLSREEYDLPLTAAAYKHLKEKADGLIISKKRYLIPITTPEFSEGYKLPSAPLHLKIELDVFDAPLSPLVIAEVEFPDEETAKAFIPPSWLGKDVTADPQYHNSNLSRQTPPLRE